jgi:hypothetical protein
LLAFFCFSGTGIPACALFLSEISKLNSKEKSMSSLSPKDRVSLCIFTYADGRRCRTPRISSHPYFCYYHAQKESRAAAADALAKDLACFFSGHYISANDLSTALARLLPAIVRGDIKPRTARTVAYMAQTLLQAIHHAQSEFQDAFGSDNYRKAIRTGITSNHDRLFPPDPAPNPAQAASPAPETPPTASQRPPTSTHRVCHPERSEGSLRAAAAPTNPTPSTQPSSSSQASAMPQPGSAKQPAAPDSQPTTQTPSFNNQLRANQQRPPKTTDPDPYIVHFDHNYRLREPEKAF